MATRKFKVSGSAANAKKAAESDTPMFDEATMGLPPKGPYRMAMNRFSVGTVKGGDNVGEPKVVLSARIAEPAGTKKAPYNGYTMYLHINTKDESAGRINALLDVVFSGKTKAQLTKVKTDFWNGNISYDDQTDVITKIGTMSVPETLEFGANVTRRPASGGYEASADMRSIFPASQLPKAVEADDDDIEDEDVDEEEEDNEVEDDAEGDEELDERTEELEAMKLPELRAVAKELGLKTVKKDADTLIEEILEEEFPEDEEVEDEEDEEVEDEEDDDPNAELREELEALSAVKLKARAKANGAKLAEYKALDQDGLVEFVIAQEADEDEDEEEPDEEEEPEDDEEEEEEPPAKPARRGRAAAKAPATKRPARRAKKGDDEPPF